MKYNILSIYLFLAGYFTQAQPAITFFSPKSGPVGTAVTITGNNFSSMAANNIVYFGAVKAQVTAATTTSLTTLVPAGATYQPITVTTNNLTAYTNQAFLVSFGSSGSLFAPASFAPRVDSMVGTNPYDLTISDFNQDGKPDVAVSNYNGGSISILKNTAAPGVISFDSKINLICGNLPYGIVAGDLDGDGKPDIAVVNWLSNTVSVFRNTSTNSDISFASKIDFVTGTAPQCIAIGDLDGDGKPDLVVGNVNSFSISIFRNTGSNGMISFASPVAYTTVRNPVGIAIMDIDGDGKPEISVAVTNLINAVSVFRNNSSIGLLNFSQRVDIEAGPRPFNIAAGDLDDDGKADLMVTNNQTSAFSILKNTSSAGGVSFGTRIEYSVGQFPQHISINDFDGDGKPDIAVSRNDIALFKNKSANGIISFYPKVDYPNIGGKGISASDMDGDGKSDLIIARLGVNTVSVLRNKIPSIAKLCPAGNATFSTNVTGTNYQWQLSTDSVNFNNITSDSNYSATNISTLHVNNIPSAWYGYQYRCVVDGVGTNAFSIQFSNTWTGAVNTVWENTANWSCGLVPDSNTDVEINAGSVIINVNTTIRSLTVNPGASCTVNPAVTLHIIH